jgi:hypothetical protein
MQSIVSTAMSAVDLLIMVKNLEDEYGMQKIIFYIILLWIAIVKTSKREIIINSENLKR